jgi:hypothetical protein
MKYDATMRYTGGSAPDPDPSPTIKTQINLETLTHYSATLIKRCASLTFSSYWLGPF